VHEPVPGRVLVERDLDSDAQTTFRLEPIGDSTDVTITSDLISRPGVAGAIERFLAKRFLLGLYKTELGNLDAKAQSR
jgi:hypothetical protein